jgi:hypothetical protein
MQVPWLVVGEWLRELPLAALRQGDFVSDLIKGVLTFCRRTLLPPETRHGVGAEVSIVSALYCCLIPNGLHLLLSNQGVLLILKERLPKEQRHLLAELETEKPVFRVQDEGLLTSEISGPFDVSSTLAAPELAKSTGSGRDAKLSTARQQASDLQSMSVQSLLPAELNEHLSAPEATLQSRAAVGIVLGRDIDSLQPAGIAEVMCRAAAQPMNVRTRTSHEHPFWCLQNVF